MVRKPAHHERPRPARPAQPAAPSFRSPAELSAVELVDAEHRPLLLPEQRQLADPLQSLGGEATTTRRDVLVKGFVWTKVGDPVLPGREIAREHGPILWDGVLFGCSTPIALTSALDRDEAECLSDQAAPLKTGILAALPPPPSLFNQSRQDDDARQGRDGFEPSIQNASQAPVLLSVDFWGGRVAADRPVPSASLPACRSPAGTAIQNVSSAVL